MQPNPYSAPKSVVADPKLVPVERPRVVTRAVRLLWAALALGLFTSFSGTPLPDADDENAWLWFATVGIAVVWFGIGAWLIFKLSRGRSWARAAYVVLAILSYGLVVYAWGDFVTEFERTPYRTVLEVVSALAELTAIVLLFTKPANAWYAAPMKVAGRDS
jgi:hypothetical protein